MLHKTRGIVFRFTKFGDSSIIVTIFTELFGLQSYMVNGVRSKAAKNKIALYQPLTLLELVVYYKENANLKRIKEVKCFHPYSSLQTDIRKSSIAIFMNEILNKTVKEESHAQELFNFLVESFIALDTQPTNYENFHLLMLLKLSRYLGFGAHSTDEIIGRNFSTPTEVADLEKLLHAEFSTPLVLSATQRRILLDHLLRFYAHHIDTLGEIKSQHVLREVLG